MALGKSALHVPFRNSKLTQVLQPSLSGDAKVRQRGEKREGEGERVIEGGRKNDGESGKDCERVG
mgnify:CR=1 FL=1